MNTKQDDVYTAGCWCTRFNLGNYMRTTAMRIAL